MVFDFIVLFDLLFWLFVDWESEVVEFKCGKDGFLSDDFGKYVFVLVNEVNLCG